MVWVLGIGMSISYLVGYYTGRDWRTGRRVLFGVLAQVLLVVSAVGLLLIVGGLR